MVNDRLFPRPADLATCPSWVASEVAAILMEQTQLDRARITPAFKALVCDAFGK
jgi:hypothetical protein